MLKQKLEGIISKYLILKNKGVVQRWYGEPLIRPLQKSVAVKIIPRKYMSSKFVERELLTMKVASEHPNILPLLDVYFTAKVSVLLKFPLRMLEHFNC